MLCGSRISGPTPISRTLIGNALKAVTARILLPRTLIGNALKAVPGFWFTVGLLIIGAIMAWVGIWVAALLATAVDSASEEREGFGSLIMFPAAAIFGFIPVFIYGAWLGAQLKHGL